VTPANASGNPPHIGQRSGPPLLSVTGLRAGHDGVEVLRGVDLCVGAGEVVALLGANGAGKTTTLLAVSGLVPVMHGRIELFGVEQALPGRFRERRVVRAARAGLAHVPEDRALFNDLTVAENIRLGTRGRGASATSAALDAVEPFPALGRLMGRRAGLLSGGEQQMLALARALAGRPRLLLIDELSLGLAPVVVEQLLPVLRGVAASTGVGILLIEQHVALALAVADRAYLLQRGRVVLCGPVEVLAAEPDLLTAGYLGDRLT
jgi:branched-chain amino acid transport system ATP-binding protein